MVQILNKEGQLKKGDKIKIIGKSMSDDQLAVVREIITIDDNEEIIFDKRRNRYFITSLVVKGLSWAKQVQILDADS